MPIPVSILQILKELTEEELEEFKFFLNNLKPERYTPIPRSELERKSRHEVTTVMTNVYPDKLALEVLRHVLRKMKKNYLAHKVEKHLPEKRRNPKLSSPEQPSKKRRLSNSQAHVVRAPQVRHEEDDSRVRKSEEDLHTVVMRHKQWLKETNKFIFEETAKERKNIPLNQIYTDLTVTDEESKASNDNPGVLNSEKLQCPDESRISCNDIFGGSEGEIRAVLTKGVAGIGKTVSVQKFILDWAENKANQDMLLFVLPFRKLNLIKDKVCSLHELLVHLHPKLKGCDSNLYVNEKILFIFDGLEECQIAFNFGRPAIVSDVDEESTVDLLIVNLINRELLPSALVWITSRPAAASLVPSRYIDRMTEIQGFSDTQKEEYFKKRVKNEAHADRIISHIKAARSLHTMCQIPVFCWIMVTVLQPWLTHNYRKEIPTTLTEMYSHFLFIQTNKKNKKFDESYEEDFKKLLEHNRGIILKLAKLAFKQLLRSNVMFYEEDLKECDIDIKDASWRSGIFTEIVKMESEFHRTNLYCFVHLSFQEFFAALYVFSCYLSRNMEDTKLFLPKTKAISTEIPWDVIMKCAMDEALKSKNGHLDLFLRFLHGLTLESSQKLLKGLLTHTHSSPESIQKIIQNLKRGQKKNINPERWINISHCLLEMKDTSLKQEIQAFLESKKKSKKLNLAQCSAMADMFQASENAMDQLDLKKFNTSEEGRRRLIPAVRNCKKAILSGCNLTRQSCEYVASAMQSSISALRELNISNNDLQDSGMKLLCDGLKCSHCKLEILNLSSCKLTSLSCKDIAAALRSPNSTLRNLDLSYNDLQDGGVELLSSSLKSPHCKLETLRLSDCRLTWVSCRHLSSALQAKHSFLKDLDLSCNDLQNLGIKEVSRGLKSSLNLKVLRLSDCKLTEQSCEYIASVLQKADSSLRELVLSDNYLQDSGVALLVAGLKSSHCSLKKLGLSGCCITENGCSSLALALRSNPVHLRELDLSYNHPGALNVNLKWNLGIYKLTNLRMEHGGRLRMVPGMKKYGCKMTLDLNTANVRLAVSDENKRITHVKEEDQKKKTVKEEDQTYRDGKQRFQHMPQVLCKEVLSGRCYWEAEWIREAVIAVTYKGISRKGRRSDCLFGRSKKSWSLSLSDQSCLVWHNNENTAVLPVPSSNRVGVFLDWPAGTLSFYSVSSNEQTHLHTFRTSFTEPLYAGFGLENPGSSVSVINE